MYSDFQSQKYIWFCRNIKSLRPLILLLSSNNVLIYSTKISSTGVLVYHFHYAFFSHTPIFAFLCLASQEVCVTLSTVFLSFTLLSVVEMLVMMCDN